MDLADESYLVEMLPGGALVVNTVHIRYTLKVLVMKTADIEGM
jgi:hypothetical protein